jgi:hypothetical protein
MSVKLIILWQTSSFLLQAAGAGHRGRETVVVKVHRTDVRPRRIAVKVEFEGQGGVSVIYAGRPAVHALLAHFGETVAVRRLSKSVFELAAIVAIL